MRQKVFISWSGEQSKVVAEALRAWIPLVLQNVDPWISSSDIQAGARWNAEIARELEVTRFGIICVTSENMHRPWLLFEAGALGKTLESTYVCPYLLDVDTSQLPSPLAQFQAIKADGDGTLDLIRSLNDSIAEDRLAPPVLNETFGVWWERLNDKLREARSRAESLAKSKFQLITDKLERTTLIAGELRKLADSLYREHTAECVRFSGALSSLAIGDEELEERKKSNPDYADALGKERDYLLELAREGCLLRCIITPPQEYDVLQAAWLSGLRRLEYLLAFLESTDKAHRNIEWAVSPFRQRNTYIIGRESCFEGFKRGIESGFDLTLRQSSEEAITVSTSVYDALFDHMATYTLTKYSKDAVYDRRDALRLATINALKAAREACLRHGKKPGTRSPPRSR